MCPQWSKRIDKRFLREIYISQQIEIKLEKKPTQLKSFFVATFCFIILSVLRDVEDLKKNTRSSKVNFNVRIGNTCFSDSKQHKDCVTRQFVAE